MSFFFPFLGLQINESEMSQLADPKDMEERFAKEFLSKTRDEWTEVFKDLDACFAPILEMTEADKHEHNIEIGTFLTGKDGKVQPAPAPRLSRTPGVSTLLDQPKIGQHTVEEMLKLGLSQSEIQKMIDNKVLYQFEDVSAKL